MMISMMSMADYAEHEALRMDAFEMRAMEERILAEEGDDL